MAGISDNLELFREISKKHYADLIENLGEKYCWKCPMRTNSSESFCREVDSWVRLSVAFEMGIYDHLRERGIPNNCLEVLAAKMLEKSMKNDHASPKFQKLSFLKMDQNMGHGINKGDFLVVNEDTHKIKVGDKVLLPKSCPLSSFWFTKTSFMDSMPLKIFIVEKIFHKAGVKFIDAGNFDLPLEYVYGIVLKIINKNDPIFSELQLNNI